MLATVSHMQDARSMSGSVDPLPPFTTVDRRRHDGDRAEMSLGPGTLGRGVVRSDGSADLRVLARSSQFVLGGLEREGEILNTDPRTNCEREHTISVSERLTVHEHTSITCGAAQVYVLKTWDSS